MTSGNNSLSDIVERLAPWQFAFSDSLASVVRTGGSCLDETSDGDCPGWLFDETTERGLAAEICDHCPVHDPCLELELRVLGAAKVGMWGVLGEDGRRALHPLWRQARENATDTGSRGDQR